MVHPNLGPPASFPLGNLRVINLFPRNPPYVWHSWREEDADDGDDPESDDPNGLEGVMKEFMV